MIRVYFCKWSTVPHGEDIRIVTPFNSLEDSDIPLPGIEWISYHYSPSRPDGLPDKESCIVFVKGTNFKAIDKLKDIDQIPMKNWKSLLVSDLTKAKDTKQMMAIKHGVSREVTDIATTWRELIEKAGKDIHPNFKSWGKHIRDEDFAEVVEVGNGFHR